MDKMELALRLLEKELSSDIYEFIGPIAINIVNAAEEVLKIKFPPSYFNFLVNKGAGGIKSNFIFGLTKNDYSFNPNLLPDITAYHVVWSNLYDRKYSNQPHHIICISDLGDGSQYALDLSQMDEQGECPVVVWPIGGYEMTPKLEIVAPDFGTFFLDMVKQQIEYKKEDGN